MKACGTRTPKWPPLQTLSTELAESIRAIPESPTCQTEIDTHVACTVFECPLYSPMATAIYITIKRDCRPTRLQTVPRAAEVPRSFGPGGFQPGSSLHAGGLTLTLTGCRRTPRRRSTNMAMHTSQVSQREAQGACPVGGAHKGPPLPALRFGSPMTYPPLLNSSGMNVG